MTKSNKKGSKKRSTTEKILLATAIINLIKEIIEITRKLIE